MSTPTRPAVAPTHMLEGVWPVDESANASPRELIDNALLDLPRLALEKGVVIAPNRARASIRPGREVSGSRGAALVVHVLVPAVAQRDVVDGTHDLPAAAATPSLLPVGEPVTSYSPPPTLDLRPAVLADESEPKGEVERVRRAYAASDAAKHDPGLTLAA